MKVKEQNSSLGQITYDAILNDVIYGELVSGQKLKLGELKKKYHVSVPTLREILNRLSNEGYIIMEEQRGFFVAPLS